jgi:hypothetical protein
MTGNALARALRRLAPLRREPVAWRVGPGPTPTSSGRAIERFVLLGGGPVRMLLDDVLLTVRDGAVLRLWPEECRRLAVVGHRSEPVWLALGPDLDDPWPLR